MAKPSVKRIFPFFHPFLGGKWFLWAQKHNLLFLKLRILPRFSVKNALF